MNAPQLQEREREPELLVEAMPPIQAHASFQSVGELATVTRMLPPETRAEPETPSQVILRLSSDPNFSIEKLDRLVAMFREQEVDRQRQAFNKALREVQAALKPVIRNAENKQTRSWYATLDKIAEAAMPIITEHGFSVTYNEGESSQDGFYKVNAILAHDEGFERPYSANVPADSGGLRGNENKTKTHAFKSTLTYGRSILLCNMFNITTKNSDDDGNAAGGKPATEPETITVQQAELIRERIVALGSNVQRFMERAGVDRLEHLSVADYNDAMRVLDQREKAAQAKDPSGTLRKQLQDSVAQSGGRAR